MNKILVIFIFVLFLLSTLLVCIFRPKTHKPIVFENRNFKLEMLSKEIAVSETPELNIIQTNMSISAPNTKVNLPSADIKRKSSLQESAQINKADIQNQKKSLKTPTKSSKTQMVPNSNKQKQNINTNINEQKITDIQHTQKKIESKSIQSVEKIKEPSNNNSLKVLTEEEEIIAWNKWRSDLQNKLMRDSKIAAPIGTSFEFSFTVDKFGTISNLKTWSSNPSYTPLAVRVIKPLLLSYQKTEILNFPTGSKRVITNVSGGFTMAHSSRYSSPSDYNDYERVIK